MIGFRHADPRLPFLWEDESQPEGRWHGRGEGPAHYFADTPDGAWAEFLRHEEIRDHDDLATIRRAIWAVDLGEEPAAAPELSSRMLTGSFETYRLCQRAARLLREKGATRIEAPSAALLPGGASGWRVENGLQKGPPRDGRVVVLFGQRPDLVGWQTTVEGRPDESLLGRVRHFRARRRRRVKRRV